MGSIERGKATQSLQEAHWIVILNIFLLYFIYQFQITVEIMSFQYLHPKINIIIILNKKKTKSI